MFLAPGNEMSFITNEIKRFFYVILNDISKGCVIRVKSSNSTNKFSYLFYQEGNGNFSTPNLLEHAWTTDKAESGGIYFNERYL